MGKYYIYRHIRLDTNEPFYIGKGTKANKNFLVHKDEAKQKMSISRTGKKLSDSHIKNLSKKVQNIVSGEVFDSPKIVADMHGWKANVFRNRLSGNAKNETDYRYYNNITD